MLWDGWAYAAQLLSLRAATTGPVCPGTPPLQQEKPLNEEPELQPPAAATRERPGRATKIQNNKKNIINNVQPKIIRTF